MTRDVKFYTLPGEARFLILSYLCPFGGLPARLKFCLKHMKLDEELKERLSSISSTSFLRNKIDKDEFITTKLKKAIEDFTKSDVINTLEQLVEAMEMLLFRSFTKHDFCIDSNYQIVNPPKTILEDGNSSTSSCNTSASASASATATAATSSWGDASNSKAVTVASVSDAQENQKIQCQTMLVDPQEFLKFNTQIPKYATQVDKAGAWIEKFEMYHPFDRNFLQKLRDHLDDIFFPWNKFGGGAPKGEKDIHHVTYLAELKLKKDAGISLNTKNPDDSTKAEEEADFEICYIIGEEFRCKWKLPAMVKHLVTASRKVGTFYKRQQTRNVRDMCEGLIALIGSEELCKHDSSKGLSPVGGA